MIYSRIYIVLCLQCTMPTEWQYPFIIIQKFFLAQNAHLRMAASVLSSVGNISGFAFIHHCLLFFLFVCLWGTISHSTQGLFLGSLREPYVVLEIKSRLAVFTDSAVLSLALWLCFLYTTHWTRSSGLWLFLLIQFT